MNQLLVDPNFEATEWLRDSYCRKTTLEARCAEEDDSKWKQMIYL